MSRTGDLSPGQQELVLAALASFDPAAVYLFGSAATGRERPDSDLDLAFLPRRTADPVATFQVAQQLADALGREIDLVDLSKATTVMAKEVLRCGLLIADIGRTQRQEFEMRVLADYARLNEEREPVLAACR